MADLARIGDKAIALLRHLGAVLFVAEPCGCVYWMPPKGVTSKQCYHYNPWTRIDG